MNKPNREYWVDRISARDKKARLKEDELLKGIYKAYSDSYIAIEKELNNFYVKYATENELSYADVVKELKPIDMKQYASKLEELKKIYKATENQQIFLEMQRLGAKANVTRLQSLLDAIDIELIKNTYDVQIKIEEHLAGMYKRSYKEALEDVGMSNKVINSRAVKEALSYPWSGRNFSERIWGNKASTMNVLKEAISKGIIQGQSIQKMAKNIMDKEKVSKYNAERLVRTETNFYMTKGHIDGYKNSGVVEVLQIDAYIDRRTCSRCKDKDETTVKLSEASYGDNVPPFHPSCRCTVVPVVDINEKTGYNYNEDGTIVVTHDWKGQHVSIPRELEPYAVLETETKYRNGYYQVDRTLYDENKKMHIQIHSGHHNRPDQHMYGNEGEHKHIYTWHKDKPKPDRTSEELNDEDRNQNKDIIRKGGK